MGPLIEGNSMSNKRLSVDLPIDLHNELKALSIKYNITLSRYIKRVLIEQLYKEYEYNIKK